MKRPHTEFRQALLLAHRLGGRLLRTRVAILLTCCIFIGSGIAASLGFFAGAVQTALDDDIAEFLGAPFVVRSELPLPGQWWEPRPGLLSARTASFTTGAVGPGQYHSVALKAVSDGYPVQGALQLQRNEQTINSVQRAPAAGMAWLDRRAMSVLGARIGDRVRIGHSQFVVDAELLFEPDRLTQLQHILPRVMIAYSELSDTGLELTSGRGEFRYLFSGSSSDLEQIEVELTDIAPGAFEVLRPTEGSHPFSRMSSRASRFLGMVSVLVLVLCGSAAAVLADFVVRRFISTSAVLRCLGAERRVVSRALLLQLGSAAILAGIAGTIAGWLIQPAIGLLMDPYLSISQPRLTVSVTAGAIGTSLITIFAFVSPRLTALTRIPIVSVLRNNTEWPKPNALSISIAAFCVVLLLWAYSDNAQLVMILSTGVLGIVTLASILGWGLTRLAGQLHKVTKGPARVALRAIGRSSGLHIVPMATIALAIMAFMMTYTLRGSFLDAYHAQTLAHDGNYLFTGLPAAQVNEFRTVVDQSGAAVAGLYPTVRAHLVAINGVPIDQALSSESDTREETRSPVRLSWAEQLPDNNLLEKGTWPAPGSGDVSVDSEVMSDLGLVLGDELRFRVGDRLLNARISGQRAFKGGGSSMMFWFMFAPDALASFDYYYMGGMEIHENAVETQAGLSGRFPNIVVTDLEQHLGRIRNIMGTITRVMDSVMYLLIGAASVVTLACALTTSATRKQQTTILRSLGVTRRRVYRMMFIEYGTVGLVAGFIGIVGAHLGATLMFHYQFATAYRANMPLYFFIPLASALAFTLLGYTFNRSHVRQPPIRILQQP